MIGFQEYIINNNINVYKLAEDLKISPGNIYRWFNINRVSKKYISILAEKFNLNPEYINQVVNDINTHKLKKKGFNKYKVFGDYTIIYIETKKQGIKEAYIDTEDLQRLIDLDYCWHIAHCKNTKDSKPLDYVRTNIYYIDEQNNKKHDTIYLHNILMGWQSNKNIHVNHKDHNTLDNRKNNLEVVTNAVNLQLRNAPNSNSSTGVRNVNWGTNREEYWVQMMKNYVKYKWVFPLNQFEEACEWARIKRIEIFGKE